MGQPSQFCCFFWLAPHYQIKIVAGGMEIATRDQTVKTMKTAIVGVVVMADLFPEIRYMMVKKIVKTDLTNFMKKKCFQVTKRKLMGRDRANLKARSVVNG